MKQEEFTEKLRALATLVIAVIAWGLMVFAALVVLNNLGWPYHSTVVAGFIPYILTLVMGIGLVVGVLRIYELALSPPDQEL